MISESEISFIRDMPKVELHLHLEGAIPLTALLQLIEKYEGQNFISLEDLRKKFAYSDFANFIKTWYWKNAFIREYEDYEFIAEKVALEMAEQNIKYAEIYFSPSDFRAFDAPPQEIAIAVRKGLNKHSDKITIRLIADLVRDELNKLPQLKQILEVRDQDIIGIGLGGKELEYPPNLFIDVYEEAQKQGLRTTCHAGEAAGADYIWQAIRDLNSDRIGHGTRAIEDPNLVEYLIEHQIPVEMNPLSNVKTNVVNSLDEHPIFNFYKRGMLVSVNTDDPKMFNTSLDKEYISLMETFNITIEDVIALMRNAIQSCWCDESTKLKLNTELTDFAAKY